MSKPESSPSPYVCQMQYAAPFEINKDTKIFSFGSKTQLCRKTLGGDFDCTSPGPQPYGLNALVKLYCVPSTIDGHQNCYNNLTKCIDAANKLNGFDQIQET